MRDRRTFLEALGPDVVLWGVKLADELVPLYEDPVIEWEQRDWPEGALEPVPDAPRVHLSPEDDVMRCIVCSAEKTLDGYHCPDCK